MGNLLGEGFPEEIIKQVEQRQKVYGSGYANLSSRTSNELKYLNTNTSWVKLVSSVDITAQDIIANKSLSGIPNISDNRLAQQFVLFNGVQEYNNIRGGIDFDDNIVSEKAYGIGGNEYGPKPMMGIISANIKHENRGSIRRATVQIKAWNKTQFDIIDALYLRLGFNILLEWGHSTYFDNNGKYEENVGNSLENSFITGKDDKNEELDYQTFLRWIEIRRKQTFGNYDAMFAKVSNIHWSFMHDGSYDITLDLVSVGDVIESFKINTLTGNKYPIPTTPPPIPPPPGSGTAKEFLDVNSNKSAINRFLFEEADSLGRLGQIGGTSTHPLVESLSENTTGDVKGDLYYIRLGYFLNYIQNYIMYRVGINENNPAAGTPMLKIDTDVEDNLMYINPLQVSMDPTVCMVNKTLLINTKTWSFLPRGEKFISSITPPSKAEYGQIMNIYVNMKFIAIKMDELKDENGRVVFIDFLKGILSGINGALGGINALDAFIDETNNTIKIIDKNPIPDSQWLMEHINSFNTGSVKLNTDYAKFELYGYNTADNTAGFIKDFNFKTELSPAMSTMITVGATANATVVGENATALSRLNNGYTDRFKKTITDNFTDTSAIDIIKKYNDVYLATSAQWTENYLNWTKYLTRLSTWTFTLDEASAYKDAITNYLNSTSILRKAEDELAAVRKDPNAAIAKAKTFQPSTGFIPFNLSLTMDGLSGMKINSKFLIDSSYLPSNYPETVDFLIKGLSHKIENNRWTTMLESYCISKGEYEESTQKDINPSGQQNQQQNQQQNTQQKPGACVDPYTDKNLNKGWVGKKQPYARTIVDPSVEGPKLSAKYGKVLATAILATIQIEQNYKGFNWNLGGFDITSGGWQFNPKYHNGYVVAREGGTKLCKAFISFNDFGAFAEQISASFIKKGFDKATTGDQYALLWYTKWNGSGYPNPTSIHGARTLKPANVSLADWDKKKLKDAKDVWNRNAKFV
jgi:hypothetical protein